MTHHEVIIIGAGISGICAGIKLRENGITNFVILEKAETYGGTWRANTYPGCACDVPSGLYSFSFAQNPEWSRLFATQPEILQYVDSVARAHGLVDHTRFGVEALEAGWDGEQWQVATTDGALTSRFLIAAAGPWDFPNIPEIEGLAEFPGEVFHSAHWNHDVDLTGKRIAVIGTGASAVQFVPEIQPASAHLHLFQRTAHWVLPKPDHRVPGVEKLLFRYVSFASRTLRRLEYSMMETVGAAYHRPKPLMQGLQKIGEAYLKAVVRDPELRVKLRPRYTLGCKRILFSNNYLQALTKPNVSVHATAVARVEGSTVVGADDSRAEVDAIILGTGFRILDMPVANRVRGADGRTLAEHWQGSPEAYLGTVVAGFPNAFIILGPSLGTGHTSAFSIVEAQIKYVVDAIRNAARTGPALTVRREVQAAYVDEVQAALPGTAYATSTCNSYYLDTNGRNSFSWPWSTSRLVSRVSRFDPDAFEPTASTRKVSA